MQNNDNTRKLYDALVADNYELGDYEKFTSDISNPEYMRKLYDTMVADDYELGEYNTFSSRYSVTPQGNVAQATQATSDLFKPQSTETPSLLDMGAQPKDYFAEAGAKAMEDIRQERQAREYQEIMKPLSGIEGREQKKVLEERKRQIEAQLNQSDAVRNAAARTNMAKALENVDKELQVLNEQQKQWQEQYGSWTPSSARRFREQTMEQTWHDPYAVVPEEYKALATQQWGKEGSEDAYFSAWMNLSPEEREAFVKREHIKSFFNEETANRMQGIRERATTYAQNALSEPIVSVDPRHSASAMAARTVNNIGVQTTKALDKAEEIKQAYKSHQLDEDFFAGAYKGMKDGLTDIDNWTGLYMVGEMTNLYDIADKMEKGEALTQTEEDFLDAQAYKLAVEAALADDLGWGYSSGNVTGASVPFMLQMLASPIGGASGKAIDKGFAAVGRRAIDKFGKGILKKLLTKAPVKKVVKGLVGTVGKGIGQTILFGSDRVAAGTMERHLGNEMVAERANEEFNAGVQAKAGEDLGTALFKAGVSTSMENISEFAGGAFIDDFTKMVGKKISKEFMDAMGGSVGRRMANAAARQNANKVFRAIANNKWGQHAVKLSKSVQSGMEWDGLLNEYLEEVLNNASNVMIGDMSMEDFTSLEKNAETLLGLAWTSGFFMANNAASRVGGYARGNIALKRTDRAARQIFTGDMQEKWNAYTQALSQADGYEEVEQLYKGLMAKISENQDKELARAQMREAAAYMTNYVKMMGMNAATEEADEEEQKTPAQKDIETAQGEGIAAQGTEEELDVVEEMDESYNQLAGHLEGANVEEWLLQYGETAAKQMEAIRGSELDEQTKAMAEAYLTSAQRYEGLLLANQEEVDAIVDEATKEFDANVNQELGSVIQVLTTQGKTAYVIQGNPNEREDIRLRYEDGTTEPVSHVVVEKVLSQADAQTMRSDMIEGVRKSAVAEVVKRMQGVVPNATQMQMPVGHNVVVDGQAGVVAGVNADGTMQIQMQGGNVVNAAPQQVMDAQAYNTIMERKARARESARVSTPVREEAVAPVAEEATAAEAVAEEAVAAEEELTEAQKLLQEYMDESVSLEDRQAIVGNNVAQAKQAAMEAQAEVDAMNESKPKATDYTSIAEFKQAQEQWKAQMQEKQQALDLARQQEATWNEVQKGMVQPVETATEQTSTKAVNEYMVSDEVDENGRAFVYSPNGSIEFGVIGADTGLTPAPILLSEGMITNPSTNDGYGLVHIEARHGDQIRAAGYKSVIEFVNEVAKNYEVIREGRDRNGHQTYMLQLTDKHNNTLMVELSGDGTYWNINTAGIFKTSYGRNRKEVYHRHTTAKQSTETVGVSQGIEQSGTQMPSSMNTPTSSANKDTQSVSTEQTDKKENSEKSAESNVEVTNEEAKNHNSKHDIKALAEELGISAKRIQRVIDFANQIGVKLNFASVTRTQGDKGALTNADNMASKRTITLSKYQLAKGMAIEWVMGHELTHQIKADGNAANWEAYKQAIINALGQDVFDKRVKEQSKVYREAGAYQDMSANAFHESMEEEVCADAAGDMLLNPDNMNKVMGVPQSLASRIWSALKDMVTFSTPTRIKQAVDAWQQLAEGKELTGEADGRERHSIVGDKTGAQLEETANATRYSIVVDPQLIDELEASPKRKGYRNVVQREDGLFEAPMGNSLRGNGMTVENTPFAMGQWEQSEEHPELVYGDNKITLVKPDGKTVADVNYNPYIHNRLNTLNAQFKQAWERPDLVYIETEVPETDLKDGYMAEHAHLSTGVHQWSNGALMLSRYDKPVRIVPWDEVAIPWIEKYKKSGVHFDIVPPALRPILTETGVEIKAPHNGMGENCIKAYEEWKAEQEVKKFSLVDYQGNPLNDDGTLKVEEIHDIDDLTEEDFYNAYRNVMLPPLPQEVNDAINAQGKRVVIKKNIFGKNLGSHKDLTAQDGRNILRQALYSPMLYGQNQKIKRPNNWILIHVAETNSAVVVEVAENKDAVEIINWHFLRGNSLEQKKRQAIKEGGLILTLNRAAGNTLNSLSSASKDTQSVSTEQTDKKEISENVAESNVEVTNEEVARDKRFSIANRNQEIFVSNAARAVEGIKQEKATPQQWLAMTEKNGGLKAGEDKWLGLSDWLKGMDKKSVTKQEILDFINENMIQIEEVHYGENSQGGYEKLDEEILGLWREAEGNNYDKAEQVQNILNDRYDGFADAAEIWYDGSLRVKNEGALAEILGEDRPINSTRLEYTTKGLENKREIALAVPTIEPWNKGDEVHFGEAGEGRAVAWVRFGETTDAEGKRVLVIDEIQSKRHQEGREKGYESKEQKDADRELKEYADELKEKYGARFYTSMLPEERVRYNELSDIANNVQRGQIPDAPFDKNWYELAMKRMLRLAAEEGFDKVAWTTGAQQAERYDMGNVVNRIESNDTVDYDSKLGVDLVKQVVLFTRDGNAITLRLTPEGIVRASSQYNGHHISDIVGKELGNRIMAETDLVLKEQDLRIGGEGMKGFYDKMLPSFVSKYTKKWGAKVEDIELPNLEKSAQTMHAVNVTPEMKKSVMEGQVMFSLSAEEQSIIDTAKTNGTYMKAPNGEPTNLNEKQWAQVRTKAFKEWFGDWENDPKNASKVVDENGEPMVVYHYTPNEFTEFDAGKIGTSTDVGALGRGFYFSPSDKFTLYGTNKMALFVNAKNPMLLNDSNAFEAKEPFFKQEYRWDKESAQAFADDVQAKGYDAVYYENRGMDEIVAFDSTQIKSATDNVGTYDAENGDIRYSINTYHGSGAAFDKFDHAFMGSGEGMQGFGWGTYVSEVEGIAKAYAETMRQKAASEKHRENAVINSLATQTLQSFNNDRTQALKYLRSLLDEKWSDKKRVRGQIKIIETGRFLPVTKAKAHLYTVDIPDDNGSNYLIWNGIVPDDVIDNIWEELRNTYGEDIAMKASPKYEQTGMQLYRKLENATGSDKEASQFLGNLGFVGIKYPAQATTGGRADNAQNYVIFNESDAQIVDHRRFSIPADPKVILANRKFNDELEQYKNRTLKGVLHLGAPNSILQACGISPKEMTITKKVLTEHLKKHNLSPDDLKGLAMAIQTPILVYVHGVNSPNIIIVTEMDVNGGKLSASLRLDANGNVVEIENVRSIHSKDAIKEVERLGKMSDEELKNAFKWAEKNLVFDWLGVSGLNRPFNTNNQKLNRIANILLSHQNPPLPVDESSQNVTNAKSGAQFSITPDILAANEKYNEELDALTQENADRMIFDLGTPSAYLKSAGVHSKPMKLYGSKIIKKQKKHGFKLEELRNLPIAIADPIAVFDNHDEEGNRAILTELNTDAGNILVAISLGKGADIDFNIISSAFGKDTNKIVNWINKGFGKYYNKEKALEYLHLAAPIAAASDSQELSDATKIVQDFQNPPLPVDESSQNVANATSGEQKYSLPARPATPKRNEGEGIMEYAQRVANATEAQKAWDVANKTATDIDRQIKNSEEYRDILSQKEPQTIEEAASVALAGGKLLWNDHVDGTKVSKGAKSMMGWGEGERQKFFAMFASKENGGVSVEQMGEAVMEICSQYNIPVDETDAMAGTNAVLEVLQSAQRPSDITGYIEHNRIEQVRRMIEEEQEMLSGERNRAYMDMYGMTYDDFVEIASTIDTEDEQERSDDKNVIAWLFGQSQRQQERITNAKAELKRMKANGVPKAQYDAAYRTIERLEAKVKQTQEMLDEATKELRTAKGQATRQRKANMRYKAKKGQWKLVYDKLRNAINGKNIRSVDKSTLTDIMRAVGSADLTGIERIFGEAGVIEDIILGVNMRATQDRIDKLLATKTTALNDKGIATGKSVDASVQAILANVRKTLEGILHHDIENQIHDLRSQNWHIRHNAAGNLSQEQQEQIDANKAKIEELKAELDRELATNTANTEQAVNEQIEKLTEQIDKKIRTEEESAELMTTLALKRQMVAIHTSYQDTATVEALLRRKLSELRKLSEVRTNWVALHDGNIPKDKRAEYRQKRKALQEQIAGLEAQVREGRQATLDAMQSFAKSLEETITTGRANLKGKVQEQLQRRKEFVAKAIHDVNASGKQMQSVNEADKQENDKLPWYKRMFSPALRTFDYMLQKIATRTYGKDSWLYRQFMLGENGVMAAHDEYLRGMQTAARTLEDKAKEIFGKSYQDVMAESNRKKDIGIEILRDAEDYEPSYIPLKLTKGQATYIYMLWRMRDGYSKLATQGFTEEIMQRIEEYIGPDYIQWADWMQMEYLPMMREKYNARYREIYDTNMAAIDNYVPIRIHGQAIRKEVDLTDATASMPGMQKKNGALIQRTVNVNPIDISNNIFELIGQHIDEMEEFYAYAPVRRDMQYILSSPAFRNLLNTQEPGTFQSLLEAARIATKTNQQPESAALKAFNDAMNKTQKGLVSGNIAYRNMTAIKQVLSAPAFIGYSQSPVYLGILAGNMLGGYVRNLPTMAFSLIPVIGHWAQRITVEETAKGMPYIDKNLGETFRWCMREFPDFRERVTRGSAGDIRLEEKGFSKLLDKYTELGMSANVFIDAVTVSVGLKSIYDYEMAKAAKRISKMAEEMQMDKQWTEEEMRKASNAAKIQATLFANQTQQSSNPALLSPMQVSKNFMERSLTLYKNSSLGLMRAGIGGMRNLLRYMKGKKARRRMREEYTRMFMQEGFAENEAKKRAISYVNSEARKGAFVALLEGYAMNVIWNLGSKGLLGFMAGGGDEDDKERTIGEWVWDGIKHVIKNTFGSAMPFVNDALEGRLPVIGLTTSEAEKAWKDIKKQLDENGISLALVLTGMRYAAKFGGADMQVWANTMDGYYRLFSETGNSDDNILALMLILNSPHSNRMAVARELYKGKSKEEFQKAIELAGRYSQPVWAFGREMTDKVESDMVKWYLSDNATDEERQRMRDIKKENERIDNLETVEDALEMFDEVSDTELRKKISSKIDQLSKPEETFAEKVDRKKENALAEDDTDMDGYTYMKMSDSQDLLEEKRMRAEIDMLRPIVERQKDLFEEYGSKSAVYTRFMAEHGAEIRRYNTLKAYSRAIQTRKRKMDEEGADVQALYEEIKELYNDARNV